MGGWNTYAATDLPVGELEVCVHSYLRVHYVYSTDPALVGCRIAQPPLAGLGGLATEMPATDSRGNPRYPRTLTIDHGVEVHKHSLCKGGTAALPACAQVRPHHHDGHAEADVYDRQEHKEPAQVIRHLHHHPARTMTRQAKKAQEAARIMMRIVICIISTC
jgi:hypothetical protein